MRRRQRISLRRAAESGRREAQIEFARAFACGAIRLNDGEVRELFPWLLQAALQGDPGAQCEVGHAFARGLGIEHNDEEAFRWYRRAAERGDVAAKYHLACAYATGRGSTPDQRAATQLFREAADEGDLGSQAELGLRLRRGLGTDKDPALAVRLLLDAATGGARRAQAELAHCYIEGDGVQKDHEAALRWARRAAEAGDITSYYTAGWLCAQSEARRNLAEAERWFGLAVEASQTGARAALRRVRFERYTRIPPRWIRRAITISGWAALLAHTVTAPAQLDPVVLLIAVVAVPVVAAMAVAIWAKLDPHAADMDELVVSYRTWAAGRTGLGWGAALWRIPAEDGFFALPLLYFGLTPLTGAGAAVLFGLAHYPQSPVGACVTKSVLYFGILMLLLPYGIWAVVAFHFTWDLFLLTLIRRAFNVT